jgi:hypothetical protein
MPVQPDTESSVCTHTIHGTSTYEIVEGYPVQWDMTLTVDTPGDPRMVDILQAFVDDLATLPNLTVQWAHRDREVSTPVTPTVQSAP